MGLEVFLVTSLVSGSGDESPVSSRSINDSSHVFGRGHTSLVLTFKSLPLQRLGFSYGTSSSENGFVVYIFIWFVLYLYI